MIALRPMRVLVVHHGPLPTEESTTTGGALRAGHHVAALRAAGHEVHTLAREQDGAGGFRGPAHLRKLADQVAPDWILCVAAEEAPALAPVAPLVVDLYAPRVLEAAWEGAQPDEAARAIRILHAADLVLFSNPRQRWHWTGALGLCGWDLTGETGRVVPLVADVRPRREAGTPTFVVGGHPWPWADARETVARAVAHLRGRADVHTFGVPPVDGAVAHGLVPYGAWRASLAGASAALDRYAPNLERELAVGFRQMDCLGSGVPLITDGAGPLADEIRATAAGWVDEPLEDALDQALAAPRHDGASTLAQRFSRDRAEAPLLSWTPQRRARDRSAMATAGQLASARATAARDRQLRDAAEAEVDRKRAEVAALTAQTQALTTSVAQLSAAMADVAGFRRETVQVLGARLTGHTEEAEHLRRELAIAQAELEKKDLELAQIHRERDRLGGVIKRLTGR